MYYINVIHTYTVPSQKRNTKFFNVLHHIKNSTYPI